MGNKNSQDYKYELVLIVDGKLTSEQKEAIKKEVTDSIKKNGGKVVNSRVWLEKQRLTFAIKKCKEGTYYLINFEGGSALNEKLRNELRLSEKILRFEIIKAESKVTAEVK